MSVLHAFFDESGKFHDHKWVAFCGFGASFSQLVDFDKQWENQLRRTGLSALHWVKARRYGKALSRKIGPQTFKDRMRELKPFADCINDYLGLGVATAFEVTGYTSFPPRSKQLLGGSDNPFYVQFLRTVELLLEYAKTDEQIYMMCDEDEETAWNSYSLYRRVKELEAKTGRRLIALTFANDEYFPALQAADMLSFLCREQAELQFYKTQYEYYPFFRYLTNNRGTSSLEWRVAFKDRKDLTKLGRTLARKDAQRRKKESNITTENRVK